jgi:hypothetical protein
VGKAGTLIHPGGSFYKSPVLHSPDLENLATRETTTDQSLEKDFHFSHHNYGYDYLFLLSIYSFPHLPSHSAALFSVSPEALKKRLSQPAFQEFRKESCFPPTPQCAT